MKKINQYLKMDVTNNLNKNNIDCKNFRTSVEYYLLNIPKIQLEENYKRKKEVEPNS